MLGHRLIDIDNARPVRAYDVAIDDIPGGWVPSLTSRELTHNQPGEEG